MTTVVKIRCSPHTRAHTLQPKYWALLQLYCTMYVGVYTQGTRINTRTSCAWDSVRRTLYVVYIPLYRVGLCVNRVGLCAWYRVGLCVNRVGVCANRADYVGHGTLVIRNYNNSKCYCSMSSIVDERLLHHNIYLIRNVY